MSSRRITIALWLGLGATMLSAATPASAPAGTQRRATVPAVHIVRAPRSGPASAQPLTPAQLHAAYGLPTRGPRGQTIAVVSAYDDPAIQADLAAYSRYYHLPACTVTSGCLKKLNQSGHATPVPPVDPTGQFTIESALGVELAHAVCQSCRLILAEADTDYSGSLAAAAHAASQAGATVVVTSVTPGETFDDAGYQTNFDAAHTAFVAASGDGQGGLYGFTGGVDFPASLPNVIAVGGTSLRVGGGGRYLGEGVWPGTVSGCSSFNPAPAWQAQDALAARCQARRSVADIAAMAAPGVLAHITGSGISGGPWFAVTGTSVAAPIIAGAIGLAGSVGSGEAPMLYRHAAAEPGTLHDITSGSTSPDCGSVNCHGQAGYDGPTGLGTPSGLGAFLADGGAVSARRPGVSASLLGRPTIRSGSVVHLRLQNGNAFGVQGTVWLQRTLVLGRRPTLVRFTVPARFRLGPLGGAVLRLAIPRAVLRRVGSLGPTSVYARGSVRGAAGRTAGFTTPAGTIRSPGR